MKKEKKKRRMTSSQINNRFDFTRWERGGGGFLIEYLMMLMFKLINFNPNQ